MAAPGWRSRRVLIGLAAAIAVTLVAVLVIGVTGPHEPSRVAVGRDATTLPGILPGAPGPTDATTSTSPADTTTTGATLHTTTTSGSLRAVSASTSSPAPTSTPPTIHVTTPTTTVPPGGVLECTSADLTFSMSVQEGPGPPDGRIVEDLTLSETNGSTRTCWALQGTPRVCIGGADVVWVSILDSTGADVYSAPPGGCSGPPATRMTLGPGQVQSYEFIWDKDFCPGSAGWATCPFLGPPPPRPPPREPAGRYFAHTVWSTIRTPVTPPDAPFTIT